MIVADHSSTFKAIYSKGNSPIMGYNTKSGAIISGKKKRRLLLEIMKKESKKLKSFQNLQPEHSGQSE